MPKNTVVWFEIPVADINRAQKFYGQVFDVKFTLMENGPAQFAMFPFQPGDASGSLAKTPDRKPSQEGPVVYLNGGDDLSGPLAKVSSAGGKILQDKTSIGEHGFIGFFQDTEGNRIGIHSMK